MSIKEKSITRDKVIKAYRAVIDLNGIVHDLKKLGTFGVSYLYSIFKTLGVELKRIVNPLDETLRSLTESDEKADVYINCVFELCATYNHSYIE